MRCIERWLLINETVKRKIVIKKTIKRRNKKMEEIGMKKIEKLLPLIGVVLMVVAVYLGAGSGNSNTTPFCGRELVNVPEWLDISEPEGGLAPGATASGLLAIRVQQYIRDHEGVESFEITEAGKTFISYDEEKERIESADNGGAHIMIRQKLLDESIAQTAMTLERSKDTDPSKVEAIYASIEDSDFYWDPSTEWCFEPRQDVKERPDALNYNMKEDEHLYAWTKQGVMLQACYNGFVYASGRKDPVCVMARKIIKTGVEDTFTALAFDIHEKHSNIPNRYLVYCNGYIARENWMNGQMEVCPWYADATWEGTDYYPRLSNKRGDSFVFIPEGTSEFKFGEKSVLADSDGFRLVEYDQIQNEWYVRCRLTGAGDTTAIYGDNGINVVASDCGLFVISPTSISLVEGISTVNVEDGIYVYDKKTMKRLTTNKKFTTDDKLRLTKEVIEELKTGSLLNHPLETILEFSEGDPAKLNFPTETAEVFFTRADGMNKEEWPYNETHAEIRLTIDDKLLLTWSTLSY